jgi:nitroreductase
MSGTQPVEVGRLSMSLGEAMFTQRAIRRFRPEPIPTDDLRLIVEAAVKAPNGGNQQRGRFLVVLDRDTVHEFGALYREAWWAKRADEGFRDRDELPPRYLPAAGLADAMGTVPCIVFALALPGGSADSIIPAVQNLMLAARGLGIGSVPTTLHPTVMDRFRAMFGIPADVRFHFCVPLGYPAGRFGPNVREPTARTTFLDRWDGPVPWAD